MKDLFILSPAGLTGLSDEDKTNSLVIYLNPPAELRRQRLSARSDADTVDRRISADERDFSAFSEYDIMITNIF
jgi:cytidylate kinase